MKAIAYTFHHTTTSNT